MSNLNTCHIEPPVKLKSVSKLNKHERQRICDEYCNYSTGAWVQQAASAFKKQFTTQGAVLFEADKLALAFNLILYKKELVSLTVYKMHRSEYYNAEP